MSPFHLRPQVLAGTGDFAAQDFKHKCLETNQDKFHFFQMSGVLSTCVFSYVAELQNSMLVGYLASISQGGAAQPLQSIEHSDFSGAD